MADFCSSKSVLSVQPNLSIASLTRCESLRSVSEMHGSDEKRKMPPIGSSLPCSSAGVECVTWPTLRSRYSVLPSLWYLMSSEISLIFWFSSFCLFLTVCREPPILSRSLLLPSISRGGRSPISMLSRSGSWMDASRRSVSILILISVSTARGTEDEWLDRRAILSAGRKSILTNSMTPFARSALTTASLSLSMTTAVSIFIFSVNMLIYAKPP